MSEDLLPLKKTQKEQHRKRSSRTEVYHLPKEIFVVGESTTTKAAFSDLKQMQMPAVVVIKDESRHEDDDHELSESAGHERHSHPKSPRPSYRGRRFTFEGLSPVGTKSLQSGEAEDATESQKPLVFVKKISLVHEENSTIESVNSTGNERDLLTPMSNTYTGPDYTRQKTTSEIEADRRREELLCALPTPHASNSAFSGERAGGVKGIVDPTSISQNFLNPFPFDEAATVQAGRLRPQHVADQEEEKNYYSEPKPVSSDEGDPDWYIEFQIKNGIIAENSGPDDESVTIADCNATFKEMCGLAVPDDKKKSRNITKSATEALGDHMNETRLELVSSYKETTDVVTEPVAAIERINHELDIVATKAYRRARRRGNKSTSSPGARAKRTNQADEIPRSKSPNPLPKFKSETGNDNPPSTIEILFKGSSSKNGLQTPTETRAVAYDAAEEQSSPDSQSHATGPSDLTASSRSLSTGNPRKLWAPDVGDSIPMLEVVPSDEVVSVTRAKPNDVSVDDGQGLANEDRTENIVQAAISEPNQKENISYTIRPEPRSTPGEHTKMMLPSLESDDVVRRQAVAFKKQLARRFVRQAIPMGYSQAYLKSSTSEITANNVSKLREKPPVVQVIKETGGAADNVATRQDVKYGFESRRNYGIGRKLQYVRPVVKETVRTVNAPHVATATAIVVPDKGLSSIFGCAKTTESPAVAHNPDSVHEDANVNTACLLDNDDTRSISPAPSDEFEQRIAYNGCDLGELGSPEWSPGEMASETASNLLAFNDGESNVVSEPAAATPEEPEMVDVGAVKPQTSSDRDVVAPPSEDNSIVHIEEGDDGIEKSVGDNEDWIDQISAIMCSK